MPLFRTHGWALDLPSHVSLGVSMREPTLDNRAIAFRSIYARSLRGLGESRTSRHRICIVEMAADTSLSSSDSIDLLSAVPADWSPQSGNSPRRESRRMMALPT